VEAGVELAVAWHLVLAVLTLLWPLWPAKGVSSAKTNNFEQVCVSMSILVCHFFFFLALSGIS
jgi:hypothetical protein